MTDNDTTRRRFLQATGGAAAAVALAGCSGGGGGDETDTDTDTLTQASETETSTPEQEQSDKTYNVINSTLTTLDPVASTDEASSIVIHNLHDALTNYVNGTTTTEPLLAESVETNDDGSVLTFNLRSDATFNGDYGNVTASDAVYSLERLAQSDNSRRAGFLLGDLGVEHETDSDGNYVPGSIAVEAEDESTLTMSLAQPFHATMEMLAYDPFSVIPEGIVGDIEGYEGEMEYETFAQSGSIGAGPFTLDTWSSGSEVIINARDIDDYHGPGPYISSVNWQIIEDANAAYTYSVINRNADKPSIPNAQYDAGKVSIEGRDSQGRQYGTYGPLENDLTANYYRVEQLTTYYIGFNAAEVPKFVRQAVAYVTNQSQIVNEVLSGPGKTASHFTPPNIYPGGANAYLEHESNYPYGLDETRIGEARSIMEENGYSEDDPYEVTFTRYAGSQFFTDVANILRDQLASAGVQLNLEEAQFSTLTERGRNGDLDMYTLGWGADYPAPDNFLKLLNPPNTDTSQSAPLSYLNWDADESEAAQQAAEAWQKFKENPAPEAGQEARNEAYVTMEEANWEDVMFLNIFHPIVEKYSYDWVDKPRVGAMGGSSQKESRVRIEDRE
ncbi:ABC transporter substrate-binding protein [Halostella salina]|uniref:ABC transporter substrate-binding protein n=1 Tax=Halostella salina TaxID=1547897 RepID=UPI000EF82E77|nr:ABC transporter substrate-binding protein [Halostella salina]